MVGGGAGPVAAPAAVGGWRNIKCNTSRCLFLCGCGKGCVVCGRGGGIS